MADFQPGEIVKLKGGGPNMTVVRAIGTDITMCNWFSESSELQTYGFMDSTIERVESKPVPRPKYPPCSAIG